MGEMLSSSTLVDAFPWVRKWIERVRLESYFSSETEWGHLFETPIREIHEEDIERLVSGIFENPINLAFSELYPFIPGSKQIGELKLSVKSRNCLLREGYETFDDLSGLLLDDLDQIRNLGRIAKVEIFTQLFKLNINIAVKTWLAGGVSTLARADDGSSLADNIQQLIEESQEQNKLLAALDVIGGWRAVSSRTDGFDLLNLRVAAVGPSARKDLVAAFQRIQGALAEIELERKPLFPNFLDIDLVMRDVISHRICSPEKLVLQELGDMHSVTRERIRQLETAARHSYKIQVDEDARIQYLIDNLRHRIIALEYLETIESDFPNQSTYEGLGGISDVGLILGFESEFHIFGKYVSKLDKESLSTEVLRIAKSDASVGLVGEAPFLELLAQKFGNANAALEFGIESELLEIRSGFVIPAKTSLIELAELALAQHGSPMPFENLAELVLNGRSERSFRNALFSDSRFVRTSLTEWALATWDIDAYTSIKNEMLRVIDEGGEIHIDALAKSLASKYGVSSSSVTAYAAGWPFQTIGGIVSKADSAIVSYGRPLANHKDIFNIHGDLMLRLKYGAEQERGSGTNISKAAAAFLGLNHGQTVEFFFHHQGLRLKISFAGLQPSLGSVRDLAISVAAEIGDQLFLLLGHQSKIFNRGPEIAIDLNDLGDFLEKDVSRLSRDEIRETFTQLLSLEKNETFPAIFSALRNRGEFKLESELRALVGDNEAFDLEINLKSESKFKISQINNA